MIYGLLIKNANELAWWRNKLLLLVSTAAHAYRDTVKEKERKRIIIFLVCDAI